MSLKIFVDHAQRRLWRHRIGVTVAGQDFNGGGDLWREVVTDTMMLCPYCLTPEWSTNSSGNYARWGLSDFGLSTGDGWYYKSDKDSGQNRMAHASPMADPAFTDVTLAENQGVWVSFYNFNPGDQDYIVFECGWSDTGFDGVQLRFWSGGRVEIWKDNIYRGTRNLNGVASRNNANKYVNLVLLPFRKRELLVYSHTAGGGFTFLFEEIAEDEPNPIVTAASKFGFQSLIAPDVEIAPLRFPTSGWQKSLEIIFADVPEAGRPIENFWDLGSPLYSGADAIIYGHRSYHGDGGVEGLSQVKFLEANSDVTTFVPNGVKRKCSLRIDLVGNGLSTPFIYGIHRAFQAVYESTLPPSESVPEVEVTDFVIGAPELNVPDNALGVVLALEFDRLDELEEIAPKITKIKNRPCRVELDGVTLIDGFLNELEVSGDSDDRRLKCVVGDIFCQAERIQLTSRIPFDGLPLCRPLADGISLVGFLCRYLGRPDNRILLDDANFTIPYVPGGNAQDFGFIGENGDTIQRCFEKTHEVFFKNWGYGEKPYKAGLVDQPVIFFIDPINFSVDPFKTLYCSDEAATEGEVDDLEIRESQYDAPVTKALDVEGNIVIVTGYDPRTVTGIQAIKRDEDSARPGVHPSARNDNWAGIPLTVGVLDGRFISEESCARAAAFGFDLISQANYVTEVPTLLVQNPITKVPAWRFDLVRLEGYEYPDLRLTSFKVVFDDDTETDVEDLDHPIRTRSTMYTGGTLYNKGGVGMRQIFQNARATFTDRSVKGDDSEKVLRALVAVVKEVP